LRERTLWSGGVRRPELAVRFDVGVERHLIGAMTPTPEAVSIPCLVDDDSIDPRAEARLAAESADRAEDQKEDFLGEVEGFVAVAEQVHRQLHDHPLMLGQQLGVRRVVAGSAPLDEGALPTVERRKPDDPSLFHREVPKACQSDVALPTIPTLDPGEGRKFL